MKRLVSLWSIALLAISSISVAGEAPPPRPNILFIFCDDLGYGDIGVFYQNQRAAMDDPSMPHFGTPAIDTMARDGAMLMQHYSAAPVCAPSRASLLTGVTQGHATVRDNQFDKALPDTHTLGSVLQEAGYATAAFGKWGLQGAMPGVDKNPARDRPMRERIAEYETWDGYPTKRGFDYFYGYARHRDGHFHYPKEDGREVWENDREVSAGLDLSYTTDLFAARTKQWIIDHHRTQPDQPFFAYLAHDTPHAVLHNPSTAYPEGGGLNGGLQWLGEPGRMINTAEGTYDGWMHPEFAHRTWDHDGVPRTAEVAWPDVQKRYANLVRRIDDTVGDLMQTLDDLGIADNTLVIFTSDNGPSKESYLKEQYAPDFFDGFGPFDGIKRDTLEGGIREPSLAKWPAAIPAGRKDTSPSGHWDWLATFADLAGVPAPAASDGVSLVNSLTARDSREASTIYVEYFNNRKTPAYEDFAPNRRDRRRGQMQVIHVDGYKGLRYDIQSADDDFEIYNLHNDPQELNDLAKLPEFAALQAKMKARVLQVRRPEPTAERPYDNALVSAIAGADPMTAGWRRSLYRGDWPWVPEFATLAAREVASVDALETSDADGAAFTAWVNVPADGAYQIAIETDGAAMVFVHDSRVLTTERIDATNSASAQLAAGWHPVKVYATGAESIELTMFDSVGRDVLAGDGAVMH